MRAGGLVSPNPWAGNQGGYVAFSCDIDHPVGHGHAKQRRVYEHRLVMAEKLGRPLVHPECVHHLDHDHMNNHPDNLVLCANQAEHRAYHKRRAEAA
jgi:hypothetical protein